MLFTEHKSPLSFFFLFVELLDNVVQFKKKSDQNRKCDYRKRESDSGNRKKVSKIMKDVHQEEKTTKSTRSRRLGLG